MKCKYTIQKYQCSKHERNKYDFLNSIKIFLLFLSSANRIFKLLIIIIQLFKFQFV